MFLNSHDAKEVKCKRTKMAYLVNVLVPTMRNKLIMSLNSGCGLFSLCIDESADILDSYVWIVSFVKVIIIIIESC